LLKSELKKVSNEKKIEIKQNTVKKTEKIIEVPKKKVIEQKTDLSPKLSEKFNEVINQQKAQTLV